MAKIDGPFINYSFIGRIVDAGVAKEAVGDFDERHLSELKRMVAAMDDKEIFTVIVSAVESHRDTVIRTLEYLQEQEGEKEC